MADRYDWTVVRNSLDSAAGRGRKIPFWWRDDDAIETTSQLDRLTELQTGMALPLTLAVIPEFLAENLAPALYGHTGLTIATHGIAHQNHAPASEKKQELGGHLGICEAAVGLERARRRVHQAFPRQAIPMLVPPWNRISPTIAAALPDIGFRNLSTYGTASEQPVIPGLTRLNTHVDPIDWRGSRSLFDPGTLNQGIAAQIDQRLRDSSPEPVGLLTHHLVHDEEIWVWTEELLDILAQHPAVIWPGPQLGIDGDFNPLEIGDDGSV